MTCYITGKRYINLLCNICYNWLDYVLCNIWCYTVLGMSLRKVSSLGSNLASVTDLKGIETPHSLCCDFGGDKTFTTWTRWSGGTVQVWVQVWAPAGHLAISPKAVPEENWRFRGQNHPVTGQALGAALLLCLRVGRASTNTGYFRVDGSHGRCGPRQARLTKTYYHSCNTDSGQESTRFQCFVDIGGGRVTFFSHVRWKFWWNWREVVADQSSAHCFAQSFNQSLVSELKYDIGTNVPYRILCKAADLNRQPVLEKGVCSDSNWTAAINSPATSDGGAQKLGNNVRSDSGLIWIWSQPKFAAKLIANEMLC